MNNPYTHPRLQRLKRSSKLRSKLRYTWTLVASFPLFVVWWLSKLIPDELGLRLRRKFGFLFVPLYSLVGFLRLWLRTRPWKMLLLALPLLLALVWVMSTLFLAKNQSDEELYGDYRERLFTAVGKQDYELAGFMAGKLLQRQSYANDKRMLYIAMIAANENGSIPRRDFLLKRLTEELHYPDAHVWLANHLLANEGGAVNYPKAIRHVQAAIKVSEDSEPLKVELARLYYESGRLSQAIKVLDEVEDRNPYTSVLLAGLYARTNQSQKAYEVATSLLRQLDDEDPEMTSFVRERAEALMILADTHGNLEYVQKNLLAIGEVLENRILSARDDVSLRRLLAHIYQAAASVSFQMGSQRAYNKGFYAMDKCLAIGKLPYKLGSLIVLASGVNSADGLTVRGMRDALVSGVGPASSHLFLGLDAWKKGLMDQAEFHFRMAYAHQPETLTALEYVTRHLAQVPKKKDHTPFRLSLEGAPLWRRAFRLLDIATDIDETRRERNVLAKCLVLASHQRWQDIPVLAEPMLEVASGENRVDLLRLLVRTSRALADRDGERKYAELLKKELEDSGE